MRCNKSHRLVQFVGRILILICSINGAPLDEIVNKLPLFGRTPTAHFSGFLDASRDGCDLSVNGPICKLHYWLALAEGDPTSKPTVLWLNGGPGSSSVVGFLQELGPLLINATGGLMENPWSWTRVANVMILESPLGVGYSYCSRQSRYGEPCENTDRYTARAARAGLVDFFTNKFPELSQNDFYIVGESYAGIYIPTLAEEILVHANASKVIPLRGIAVGDPCTDNKAQADSMDVMWYSNKYGLMDPQIYETLTSKQCDMKGGVANLMSRGGLHSVVNELNRELITIGDDKNRRKRAEEMYHEVALDGVYERISVEDQACTLSLRKFLMSSSKGLSQSWKDLYIDDYSLFAPVSDLEDVQMNAYMSRSDVKKALHMEESPVTKWPNSGVGFSYHKEYDACNDNPVLQQSMIDIYRKIVPFLNRTWIYNGDADPCVSYEGTRDAVKQIGFSELDGGGYRPWFYDQTAASIQVLQEKAALFGPNLLNENMGSQMGGHIVDYMNSLSFVTFHGAGHMVPQFRPQAALHFLSKFLLGEKLSPFLPPNATLANLSHYEFTETMNAWTESAMAFPYASPNSKNIHDTHSIDALI